MKKLSIEKGMTELHCAAVTGNLSAVERLLRSSNALGLAHELNGNLEYPLYSALALPAVHTSALKADKEVIFIKLLGLSSERLTHKNRDGDTVLHRMAKNGFVSLLAYVLPLSNASDLLMLKNKEGRCAIHTAVLSGRLGIVTQLLEQHHVFETKDDEGNLPLHLAAAYGSPDMVKACFEGYKDGINFPNEQGKTPLDLAEDHNLPEVQSYLCEHGGTAHSKSSFCDTYVEDPEPWTMK
ncbi:MAG: ankyrin repeat domain-containing protein [Legionellaceae bacterium]|nr:ankyrin repeat domain-containing protein [Legionellaceae bacterium]